MAFQRAIHNKYPIPGKRAIMQEPHPYCKRVTDLKPIHEVKASRKKKVTHLAGSVP